MADHWRSIVLFGIGFVVLIGISWIFGKLMGNDDLVVPSETEVLVQQNSNKDPDELEFQLDPSTEYQTSNDIEFV